ncbi:uncharacterized protein LOC135372786 [Ornithodoros turicata]|uniref:uncharacterized protein LOC135372786 n=1 Tax=Ornithodoros turicata TaxID=34597 RepID=UPI003139A24D
MLAPRQSPIHGQVAPQHLPHGVRRPLAPPWEHHMLAPRESPIHGQVAPQHLPHGVRRPLAPPWEHHMLAPRESPIHGLVAPLHPANSVQRPLAPPWVPVYWLAPQRSLHLLDHTKAAGLPLSARRGLWLRLII